jgi:hypothetical protein
MLPVCCCYLSREYKKSQSQVKVDLLTVRFCRSHSQTHLGFQDGGGGMVGGGRDNGVPLHNNKKKRKKRKACKTYTVYNLYIDIL